MNSQQRKKELTGEWLKKLPSDLVHNLRINLILKARKLSKHGK